MKRLTWLSPVLAVVSLAWCVAVGLWLWFTPVRYARTVVYDGQPPQQTIEYVPLADASPLAPLPLFIPVFIAMIGAAAAWHGGKIRVAVAGLLLATYAVVGGFSIGSAYLVPAGLLMLATLFVPRASVPST
jgi:hypothetical protein